MCRLGETVGHEPAGKRPVLILSDNVFNQGPAGVVIGVPVTSTQRPVSSRVIITPPEGGLKVPSDIVCDSLRSIAKERLIRRLGFISESALARVERLLRALLRLP